MRYTCTKIEKVWWTFSNYAVVAWKYRSELRTNCSPFNSSLKNFKLVFYEHFAYERRSFIIILALFPPKIQQNSYVNSPLKQGNDLIFKPRHVGLDVVS